MSNRILRRPMFRMGGSANEGITSGLDKPKRGLVDEPGGYAGIGETVQAQRDVINQLAPRSNTSFNDFLINTGLDLVSRPAGGNIFQQVATSAKEPFKQMQQQKATEGSADRDLITSLVKSYDSGKLLDIQRKAQLAFESGQFTSYEEALQAFIQKDLYLKGPEEGQEITDYLINEEDMTPTIANQTSEVIVNIRKGKYDKLYPGVSENFDYAKYYIEDSDIDSVLNDGSVQVKDNSIASYVEGKFYYNPSDGGLYKFSGSILIPQEPVEQTAE